jgi:hypothetical protein
VFALEPGEDLFEKSFFPMLRQATTKYYKALLIQYIKTNLKYELHMPVLNSRHMETMSRPLKSSVFIDL